MEDKNTEKTPLLKYFLIGLIVCLFGVLIYLGIENREMNELNEQKKVELLSAQSDIEKVEAELKEKITEIEMLGGDISDLKQVQLELEKEKKSLLRSTSRQISNLKERVRGYATLLKGKDKEIERLKGLNDVLYDENTNLKKQKNALYSLNDSLKKSTKKMITKVELASRLKVENMQIFSVNKRGRERTGALRARQISKLRTTFNIAENNVAPIEAKDVFIRILNPNKQVLFDIGKGGGSFVQNGEDVIYTLKKEILFDNSQQKISFEYEQEDDYMSGKYEVEIYTDDYLMGKQYFIIK